jgi:hypothetical protein
MEYSGPQRRPQLCLLFNTFTRLSAYQPFFDIREHLTWACKRCIRGLERFREPGWGDESKTATNVLYTRRTEA